MKEKVLVACLKSNTKGRADTNKSTATALQSFSVTHKLHWLFFSLFNSVQKSLQFKAEAFLFQIISGFKGAPA